MTGAEVLAFAASYGVRVPLAFGDLRLKVDREPPTEALDVLRDHKEAVVAELGRIAAVGQLRQTFEAHVAAIMRVRSLPRPQAERLAYGNVVTDHLNATHPDTDPNRCAHCGRAETLDETLLPIGVGARHAWLHQHCRDPCAEARRKAAIETLAATGILMPSKDEAPR
jgi:hypothetical protein